MNIHTTLLHDWVLRALGDDERVLDTVELDSFLLGVLGAVDWIQGVDSVASRVILDEMQKELNYEIPSSMRLVPVDKVGEENE